jgi:hypothetical protein
VKGAGIGSSKVPVGSVGVPAGVVVSKEKSVADGVAVILVAEVIVEPGVFVLQ